MRFTVKQLQALIKQGELISATEYAIAALKDDPANADIRATYIELLCVQGALEKADQQLDMMVRQHPDLDRKSTRLNSSHVKISYAVFCLKKKNRDVQACRL